MTVEFKVKVVRIGNSLRITIPKEICEALKITAGNVVRVYVTGDEIRIRKA